MRGVHAAVSGATLHDALSSTNYRGRYLIAVARLESILGHGIALALPTRHGSPVTLEITGDTLVDVVTGYVTVAT
jgi:hypothetical protein